MVTGVAILASSAAFAEISTNEGESLEEIVVTAQKRTESLQSVPISIAVLTADQLAQSKFDSPTDLASQVPNLQVNGINGEGTPIFSLRGVSMFDYSASQSSPVASYIDEVYKGNFVLFGVEMFDLERVEVLRGPQGTLYGKNTTGGAINFITRKPGFETEGSIKAGIGNYGRREAEGVLQGALIPDRLAARFAFTYTKADGFIRNVLPGHPDLEGVDQWGARLSLLFKVSDAVSATLRLSKSEQNPQNYAILAGSIAPTGIGGTGYFRTDTGASDGVPLADDQVALNNTLKRRQRNDAASLTIDWSLTPALALTSITSWDQGSLFNPEGTDGAPIDIVKLEGIGKTRQVTQDLRIRSATDGRFEFMAGAYYQHEIMFDSVEDRIFNFLDFDGDGLVNVQDCAVSSFFAGAFGFGYPAGVAINPSCRYYNSFDQVRNSWAIYSDGSYKASNTIKFRAGIRYNHDNGAQKNALDQLRGADGVPIANLGIFGNQPEGYFGPALLIPETPGYDAAIGATRRQDVHNSAVTGHVGIDYTPTDKSLIYLGYSRGYRSAAFNAQFLFTPEDFSQVKPETLDSLETGFKTSWLANRLQFNGAAFYYQYKNQQLIDVRPTGQQPLINLDKSRIVGAELDLIAKPAASVTLHAGLGFLNTKVQEGRVAGGLVDISGNQLPDAPRTSGTLAVDWDAFHALGGKVVVHLDGTYAARQYFELMSEDRIAQPAYAVASARITFHGADDRYEVGVWGRNLADKFYLVSALDLHAFGFDYRHRGPPRMFGADATFHFR